jgi:hypothetical protein
MEGAGVNEERALGLTVLIGWAICCALVALSGCVQFAPATPAVPVVMPPVEQSERVIILPWSGRLTTVREMPAVTTVPGDAPWWMTNAIRFVEDANALSH